MMIEIVVSDAQARNEWSDETMVVLLTEYIRRVGREVGLAEFFRAVEEAEEDTGDGLEIS